LDFSTITCTTGAHAAMTGARVRLTPHGSSTNYEIADAYDYVDQTTNATITSQTPEYLDAAGGETLTFAGTNLDLVSGITIDGTNCPIATQTATSISCTTPREENYGDSNGNRKPLIITATNNTINGYVEYREFLAFTGVPSIISLSSSNRTDTRTAAVSTNYQSGYNLSVQTLNPGRETGRRSDLMCEISGSKYYISPLTTEASSLTTGATYGLKINSGNYLPLSHIPSDLLSSTGPSFGPTTPDTLQLTVGVNTDLPAVACNNYTGVLQYTLVGSF
jgi:hypothetical protein